MVGHGGSSAGSYLADLTSPIPSHCASIVVTSTVRVKFTKNVILKCVVHASSCIYIQMATCDAITNKAWKCKTENAEVIIRTIVTFDWLIGFLFWCFFQMKCSPKCRAITDVNKQLNFDFEHVNKITKKGSRKLHKKWSHIIGILFILFCL